MKVFVDGKQFNLSQQNFVAKGGEGSIFKQGATAFKIYEDLRKMIPLAKITELNKLDRPEIVRPQSPIYNEKKHLIGFTMDWLGGNIVALCKLFTNSYRDANGVTTDSTIELVENIKNVIHFIHQNKCLIVDGNELNYLVADDFTTPYFIDVNAWQTPSYQATAIMPSIRDWTTDKFNEMTDWFSFAIVAFQLFVGIHPYKGKHKAYKKNDFVNRIKDHVSVFNSSVALPPAVRDFNLIPSAYKNWFFNMFEHGNRVFPPDMPGQLGNVQVVVQLIQSTDNFEIKELREFVEKVLFHNSAIKVTKTTDHIFIGKTDYRVSPDVEIVMTPLEQIPIMVKIEDEKVAFKAINHPDPSINLNATDKLIVNNVLYLKNRDNLMEMDFKYLGGKIHPIIKTTWKIEPYASQIFSGVIYQSALGKAVLAIPLSTYAKSEFITKRIPEIDEYKILDGKYENRICVLTGHKGNSYSRIIIVFDEKHDKYIVRIVDNIDFTAINFTTLDNGVCVLITDDDAIEIFLNRLDKPAVKRIEDPVINSTMKLCKNGNTVQFYRDNKLYEIKMK